MPAAIHIEQLTNDFAAGFRRARPCRAPGAFALEIVQGEVLGVLGPNGAGKTTTLKLHMRLMLLTARCASTLGRPAGPAC